MKSATCLGAESGANSKRNTPRLVVTTASAEAGGGVWAGIAGARRKTATRANRAVRMAPYYALNYALSGGLLLPAMDRSPAARARHGRWKRPRPRRHPRPRRR